MIDGTIPIPACTLAARIRDPDEGHEINELPNIQRSTLVRVSVVRYLWFLCHVRSSYRRRKRSAADRPPAKPTTSVRQGSSHTYPNCLRMGIVRDSAQAAPGQSPACSNRKLPITDGRCRSESVSAKGIRRPKTTARHPPGRSHHRV